MFGQQVIEFRDPDTYMRFVVALFAIAVLLSSFRKSYLMGVEKKSLQRFLLILRAVFAVAVVAFIVAILVNSSRRFTRLRLEDDRVILSFRWPRSDAVIPVSQINEVGAVMRKAARGRGTWHVQIDSTAGSYRSHIYGRTEEEYAVLEKLIKQVESKRKPSVEPMQP